MALSRERDCGIFRECRAGQNTAKAYVDVVVWNGCDVELPGVGEDGMQDGMVRKSPEPLAGRLALPHSGGVAYKPLRGEIVMCLRAGGWGQLSDDGPGQHNPDRSEGPWGKATLVA